jgi:hypothetical protein
VHLHAHLHIHNKQAMPISGIALLRRSQNLSIWQLCARMRRDRLQLILQQLAIDRH